MRDLKALKVLTREMLGGEEAFDWDYSKIVMFTTGTGLGGEALKERLLTEYKIELEMASGDYTIAMTSVMDTEEGFDRLCAALHEIDNDLCKTGTMKGAIIEEIHFIRQIYAPNPGQLEIAAAEELPVNGFRRKRRLAGYHRILCIFIRREFRLSCRESRLRKNL